MKWPSWCIRINPLSIAIFYACIGGIWLLLVSTQVVTSFLIDPSAFKQIELHNTIFVLATAWLLYVMIRKSESGILQRKQALGRLNRALKAYSECNQALIRATDEMQLMQSICRTIVQVGGYRVAWVGLAEHDDELSIHPVVQWGDETGYLKNLKTNWSDTDRGRGPTGTAIRTGRPVVAQYIEYDPKWMQWRDEALRHGFASSISLPLSSDHQVFAALVIFAGEPNAFDGHEVKLLGELANDLSYGITALRAAQARKASERERRLLASVIEQAKEGLFLFDAEGVIQYVNPAIETITGRPPQVMIGANIHALEHQDDDHHFYATILNAIPHSEGYTGQLSYRRNDGVTFEINVSTWSVSDQSGKVISYVALIRDVTNERQLERQLRRAQRMESIGTLAGGIAHDFNNTLASIITCSEMAIAETPSESPLHELLDVILKSGLRGKHLVKQILTFSRRGEQEPQEVQVDLIVNECLKLVRASQPASIEIALNLGKELGQVLADPTQIHQIVMNLCTNSLHAMRCQPHGVLEVWLDNADLDGAAAASIGNLAPGSYLRLMVRDTGHGIDPGTMERIFDPFFTTKSQKEGTGLGLSVIHGIVRNHRGAITVESEPGRGATFCVYLPRIEAAGRPRGDLRPVQAEHGSERILLVDDEEDLVFAGQRMLRQLGYNVVARSDPRQALQLFRAQPDSFDIVITDQTMPRMNGTELAREISLIRPDIPIVLCTGYDPLSSGAATGDGETAEYICELALKPLERAEIAGLIRRALDDAHARREPDGQDPDHR
ncbi:ATP-binding protein [Geobacter sp. SVR]|uniref:hybrid sensor histidine kinase/response regulator n=1 Tax=Geobacter sp. SVR TaxID=2495594 RepID=UPI00143EFFAB|nr:ATP-binding protein [Geobacter sp. SVR]BCS54446.1 histidine kinase [Geobacter sp. SVR]GCF87678.1 histidine kinase [Geobacter sp. SVR]